MRTIAFGSCINTNSHLMLDRVLAAPFDLFVLLGDTGGASEAKTSGKPIQSDLPDALNGWL